MNNQFFKRIPFDLELAKKITNKEIKGRIVTRKGEEVRIICLDAKTKYPIICLIEKLCGEEVIVMYMDNGHAIDISKHSSFDLYIEVPTYFRHYSNFEPQKWQPCLVRENEDEIWLLQVSKGKRCGDGVLFYCPDGSTNVWRHCLPLSKATERLVGTTKSYEQLIKELDENEQD